MKEFVDFLGSQTPYDALPADDLNRLARAIEVEYFPAGAVIVPDGAPPLTHLFVVRTGAVEVIDRGRVVDLLGEGDTFGHVSVLSGLAPALAVRAAEDTLTYRLPDPRTVLAHPDRLRFTHYGTMIARERLTRTTLMEAAQRPVSRYMRPLVWADATTSVTEAARRITDAGQSFIIIDTGVELRIATDQDFRRLLASDRPSADTPVAAIASAPVLTIDDDAMVATAFLEMVEHGVHHLVVTDSTNRPVGVLRVIDVASVEVRNPLLVRARIDDAANLAELATAASLLPATVVELDDTGVPSTQIGALLSAVVDALLSRLITLHSPANGPDDDVSWMVLGSLARREPLPGSDVDTALAWLDNADPRRTVGRIRTAAEEILTDMEACGLRRCPDGANAVNPLFSRSVSQWITAATHWTRNPGGNDAPLLASIIADGRPLTGLAVGRQVIESMLGVTANRDFLDALLRVTLMSKPPTGFVRDFVVEHSGEHRGQLDLKRGLRPVASIGRWVAVATGDTRGSTPERLRRGQAAGLLTAGEADALVGAFEQVYALVFAREVAAIRAGSPVDTYVRPAQLDPLARRFLRETFREIAEIQGELQSEWVSRL